MGYDSRDNAHKHKFNIEKIYYSLFRPLLDERIEVHDNSKLEDPELACYNKWIPELAKVTVDDPKYAEIKDHMRKDGLNHHFMVNRHHPEHFEHGIADMNLVDFVEHVIDCYAASKASDTPFEVAMPTIMERNGYPEEVRSIIMNTAKLFREIEAKKFNAPDSEVYLR